MLKNQNLTITKIIKKLERLIRDLAKESATKMNIPPTYLKLIKEPTTSVTVKFPVEKNTLGEIETITGIRIIHSNQHLPSFGGLRLINSLAYEDLEAAAALNSYKAALHNIPFGGAIGCIFIDPSKYTFEEKVRIVRRYTVELWKRSMIGASTDIMGPDRGTDGKIMNIIQDTYKHVISHNELEVDAVVTGKTVNFSGINETTIASGYSSAKCAEFILNNIENEKFQNTRLATGGKKSIILHGLTKNSVNLIKNLPENDFKVIGIVEGEHGCFNTLGFNIDEIQDYLLKHKSLKGISQTLNDPQEILRKKADFYIPAKELIVNKEIAESLQCKIVLEAANFAIQKEAIDAFKDRKIVVVPDIISHAGELVIAYLEWLKNLEHRNLTLLFKRFDSNTRNTMVKMITDSDYGIMQNAYNGPEESDLILSTLCEIVDNSFKNMLDYCEEHKVSLREAAYMIALEKIYLKFKTQGGVSL